MKRLLAIGKIIAYAGDEVPIAADRRCPHADDPRTGPFLARLFRCGDHYIIMCYECAKSHAIGCVPFRQWLFTRGDK